MSGGQGGRTCRPGRARVPTRPPGSPGAPCRSLRVPGRRQLRSGCWVSQERGRRPPRSVWVQRRRAARARREGATEKRQAREHGPGGADGPGHGDGGSQGPVRRGQTQPRRAAGAGTGRRRRERQRAWARGRAGRRVLRGQTAGQGLCGLFPRFLRETGAQIRRREGMEREHCPRERCRTRLRAGG